MAGASPRLVWVAAGHWFDALLRCYFKLPLPLHLVSCCLASRVLSPQHIGARSRLNTLSSEGLDLSCSFCRLQLSRCHLPNVGAGSSTLVRSSSPCSI
jgi:hypothetical protein